MRIIYLGTPEFAIAPLEKLHESSYDVVAVITAPDKPAGRGKKLTPPPVKLYAESKNIPVLQPVKLKDENFLEKVRELKPDIQVVVAFRMMPRELWSVPGKGTFNLHASLLPQYRGAAPINWVIINGEKETGLTTFFIDEKIDTGEIIFREKIEIGENETAGELHDRMMEKGSELVLKTVRAIDSGRVQTQPQPALENGETKLKPAPKIYKEDCQINWDRDTISIHNQIRGLSPYPAAFSNITKSDNESIQVKIFKSEPEIENHVFEPDTLITDSKNFLKVATRDGFIKILNLQIAGKKRMDAVDFLRGFKDIEQFNMKKSV